MTMHTRVVAALGAILWLTACSSGDSSTPAGNTPPSNTQAPPRFVSGVLQAYVKASNPGGGAPHGPRSDLFNNGDEFGHSVALSDDTLVVGAPNEESCATGINGDQANNDCRDAGAVYVFTRSDNTWRQQAYIKASNTHLGDWFGWQVALNGDTLAVTALEEDGCARGVNGVPTSNDCFFAGAVYVFTRTNGSGANKLI